MNNVKLIKSMVRLADYFDDNGLYKDAGIVDGIIVKVAANGELPKLPNGGFVGSDIYAKMTYDQLNELHASLVPDMQEAIRTGNTKEQIRIQNEIVKITTEIRSRTSVAVRTIESETASIEEKQESVSQLRQILEYVNGLGKSAGDKLKEIGEWINGFLATSLVSNIIGASVAGLGIGGMVNYIINGYSDLLDRNSEMAINSASNLADIARVLNIRMHSLSKDDPKYLAKMARFNQLKQYVIDQNKKMLMKNK